jgi:pimeloyl-ACP methyl ester carboxylesterase
MRPKPTDRRDAIHLADGRRLVYRETGPRDGFPVFYCHGAIGTPLSRAVDLEELATDLRIRYIAVSRPGVGGSDPHPGRTLLSFGADLSETADALAIERFAVVGVSAGGPYALAVARALGARVTRAAVCSSLSPLCAPHRTDGMQRRVRLALAVLAGRPGLCRAFGDRVLPVIRQRPELLSLVIAAHAAPCERGRLDDAAERRAASTSFLDACADGVGGLIDDYLTYSRDWGFSAGEVETEVHLWHGLNDPLVPVEHALELAATLPRCRMFFDPDEGHHFFRRRLGQILALLVDLETDASDEVATSLGRVRALAARRSGPR